VFNTANMDSIVNYFSDMPSSHRSILLVGGLGFFFLMENVFPFFKMEYHRGKHALINIFFTLTTVIVNFSMAFLLLWSADFVVDNQVGLLQWINWPLLLEGLLGLLIMDLLAAYTPHWVQHHVKWMWMFHIIHHTDQDLDTTSANRHHPGESVIRFAFTLAAVFVVGAPVWVVFIYQTASLVLTQFNHANIKLPKWLNAILVRVICTPDMHRVHHHYRQPYSDTNYGNIFSFWDRIFGTYTEVDNTKLKYGVDTLMEKDKVNNIWELLKVPFQGYRARIEYETPEDL
jgi:sterol desaturase/sphingolipid hydroxylase (fatty acid hydroxylase superfamily)